jgi:hypothetical protein
MAYDNGAKSHKQSFVNGFASFVSLSDNASKTSPLVPAGIMLLHPIDLLLM